MSAVDSIRPPAHRPGAQAARPASRPRRSLPGHHVLAQLASLADETPEDRLIVVLAKERCGGITAPFIFIKIIDLILIAIGAY